MAIASIAWCRQGVPNMTLTRHGGVVTRVRQVRDGAARALLRPWAEEYSLMGNDRCRFAAGG